MIAQLNDFIFCPASIYFHMLYGDTDRMLFQNSSQIQGTASHKALDEHHYSTAKKILTGLDVYSEEFGLIGKVDLFDQERGVLMERKRTIKQVYDGYVFQLYAQCISLREMGYTVRKLVLHSMTDNKNYDVALPEEDLAMYDRFKRTIDEMHSFQMEGFEQTNREKCMHCIYEPACDRGLK